MWGFRRLLMRLLAVLHCWLPRVALTLPYSAAPRRHACRELSIRCIRAHHEHHRIRNVVRVIVLRALWLLRVQLGVYDRWRHLAEEEYAKMEVGKALGYINKAAAGFAVSLRVHILNCATLHVAVLNNAACW